MIGVLPFTGGEGSCPLPERRRGASALQAKEGTPEISRVREELTRQGALI